MLFRRILLAANSAWNLWNYRRALIEACQRAGMEVIVAAPPDRFQQRLCAPFFPLQHMQRGRFSPASLLLAVNELAHLMRRERPSLCLFFTTSFHLLGNWAARLTQTPAVSVVEGLGYAGSASWRWRWFGQPVFRAALRHAHRVVFLNSDDLNEMVAQDIVSPEQALLVPGPGVDTEYFSPQPAPTHQQTVFLYCGRLLRNKGVSSFVQAARAVRAAGIEASFRLLGGPDPGNPASLRMWEVMRWHREGVVEYLGPTDDVRPYIAAADAIVLPTHYREGMPRALLEAMSMEKIAVATDVPGCREVIAPGQTGFLVPPYDVQALAQTLCEIAALSAEQRAILGRAARQRVLRHFADDVVLPHYLAVLEAFFEKSKRQRVYP